MSKFDWKTLPLPETKGNLFIENLLLEPLVFNVTFQLKKSESQNNILASLLGSAIANLDHAEILLSGIRLNNVSDSVDGITSKIISKYQDDAAKIIFKVLGSLDIVGNPVGLFNNISTGFQDLLEKPMEGFLQGPLEGGLGLVKGTGSLVKNTVSGTMNSIGKVTGSIASGISSLTLVCEV